MPHGTVIAITRQEAMCGRRVWEEFRVSVSEDTISRQLRAMGYRKLSARPRHHAQAEGAIEHFKKHSWRSWRRSQSKWMSPPT